MTRSRTRDLEGVISRERPNQTIPWISTDYTHYFATEDTITTESILNKSSALTDHERREAYSRERKNWGDMNAMESVSMSSVSKYANIIGSHVRYIRKADGRVKARICPWGNHDVEKHSLRTDAPSMLMEVFRLVISVGVEQHWEIGSMDVRAAFLQADGFSRSIYVRPPREEGQKNVLWKLLAPAYGLVDSGRLWYLTSNSALCGEYGLSRSILEPTLYYSRSSAKSLELLVVVQVDNYIYTGISDAMEEFEAYLSSAFDVGLVERNNFDMYGALFHDCPTVR